MKPKRIILIRHGESQANVDKTLYGSIPDYTIELTDTGREQAREAGKRLKEVVQEESMYFYVSPFWRARSRGWFLLFPEASSTITRNRGCESRNGDTCDALRTLPRYAVRDVNTVRSTTAFQAVRRARMCMTV